MKWTQEVWKLKDLKNYAKNPRSLNKDQGEHLKKSLEKFGQCEPIVINTDGMIIGGHQRARTMKKLGYKEAIVCVPEEPLNEKEIEELNIRLNKNVGDWDWDVLGNAWEVEDLLEWGFSPEDLQLDSFTVAKDEGKAAGEKCQIIIDCISKRQLEEIEPMVEELLNQFPEATKKVNIK